MKEQLQKALDCADKGNWDEAHRIVQDMQDVFAYWIHANLHREEGNQGSARYWYGEAKKEYTEIAVKEERTLIRNAIAKGYDETSSK